MHMCSRCVRVRFPVAHARGCWCSRAANRAVQPRAVALVVVVERAKKCLDFTFTVFFIHFVTMCAVEVHA